MRYYLGIEDLAANALIESLKKNNKRFLTYVEIENYGSKVAQILGDRGDEAILVLSRDRTNAVLHDYAKYFEEFEMDNKKGIRLRDGIGIDQLIRRFRGYLALDVLLAFVDRSSVGVLGV